MKLISVIIPVYNMEDYIAFTVQSVLAQTYSNFELLIVDDGSTDKSKKICQEFKDLRIKIIEQKNQGVSAARNAGIRQAKGEFLAFLDGDDLWLPDKLEKHTKHLEKNPNVAVSFSRFSLINEAGNSIGLIKTSQIKKVTPELIFCRNPVGNPSCTVLRTEIFEQVKYLKNLEGQADIYNYFDEELHHFEDVELWLRIALKGEDKIAGIPEALTLYRVNPKGASANFSKQLDGLSKMLDKTYTYAPDLTRQYANVLKGYTLRKFAQWAIRLRDVSTAREMIHKAIHIHGKIFLEEPIRTFLILSAIYLISTLPRSLYDKIEALGLKIIGFIQEIKIKLNRNTNKYGK